MKTFLGVDIGGTKIATGLVNEQAEVSRGALGSHAGE